MILLYLYEQFVGEESEVCLHAPAYTVKEKIENVLLVSFKILRREFRELARIVKKN
jgi:hypothetical protein